GTGVTPVPTATRTPTAGPTQPPTATPVITGTPPPPPPQSGPVRLAYFDQWGIYGNAFYPKNLDTQAIASKLDFVIYDFENIDPVNLTCFEAIHASDAS